MADQHDQPLDRYREKRDFARTGEPTGDVPTEKKEKKMRDGSEHPVFVVQKHDASRLHYDFRLEIAGVLKSWAIPKGPTMDPDEKRLAVPVEDHPLDYAGFEGVIPQGEYGGGTVMIWDRGTFRNLRSGKDGEGVSLEESYKQGKIEVELRGRKLRGGFVLVRVELGGDSEENWLLMKMHDDAADANRHPTQNENRSVESGRTMEEIVRAEK